MNLKILPLNLRLPNLGLNKIKLVRPQFLTLHRTQYPKAVCSAIAPQIRAYQAASSYLNSAPALGP